MKTLYLSIIFFISFSFLATAQIKVGNNPTSINPSAVLDVESSNKGFLPPRVALQSTTDQSTIPSPATGLMVYNTSNAGSGTSAVDANNVYVWTGSKWDRLELSSNNNYINTNPFAIGELRTCVIKCNATSFFANSGSRPKMTGRGVNDTGTTNTNAASDYALNSPNYILIRGLRLDVLETYQNDNYSIRPTFYNTSSSNVVYSFASLSGIDPKIDGSNCTVRPNYYGWEIEGNDRMLCNATGGEFLNLMLAFNDFPEEWYNVTFYCRRFNDDLYFYYTAQRLN